MAFNVKGVLRGIGKYLGISKPDPVKIKVEYELFQDRKMDITTASPVTTGYLPFIVIGAAVFVLFVMRK